MFADFQDFAGSLKPQLDAAFSRCVEQILADTAPLRPPEETALLTGGKKLRGSLLCLASLALGGTLENALPRAVALELIHTASLIHDDIVDQHRARRGMPALWTMEGTRRAVLLGDILFSSAIRMMSESGQEDCVIISRTIAEISRGAYQEPLEPATLLREIEAGRCDAMLYEKIICLKTGILFGAACELGGVAAGAGGELRRNWRHYGLKLGEAFQIADDLHDLELYLRKGAVTAEQLSVMAPPLLHFADGIKPYLLAALRGEGLELKGEPRRHFQAAAALMAAEKERRLQGAAAEVAGNRGDNSYDRLVATTPWDIIRMFDDADNRPEGEQIRCAASPEPSSHP
jgi:hypothetical protein